MAKYTRSTLTGDNAPVNAELEKIQSAINDQFDRNPLGGVANQLNGDLDANSKRIYNLPAPSNPNDAARLKDVQEAASGPGTVIPDQTGQEGKYLKTDATTAFWGEVSKSSIGLGVVDNTTDLLKPVSTAQQTEINTRALQVDTFANLELLTSTTTGQAFTCQERANALYILQPEGVNALGGDAVCANGRLLQLQISGPANVKQFGAKGDNSTDDLIPIQTAITRTNNIYAPEGRYKISDQLHFTGVLADTSVEKASFKGDGPLFSVLIPTDNTKKAIFAEKGNGNTQGFISLDLNDIGILYTGQVKTQDQPAIHLLQNLETRFTDVRVGGSTNPFFLQGVGRSYFTRVVSDAVQRPAGENLTSVWKFFANGAVTRCFGIHLVDCESNGNPVADRTFDLRAVDGLYITNSHFNNAIIKFHIRPTNIDKNDVVKQIHINNCYFDGNSDEAATALQQIFQIQAVAGTGLSEVEGIYVSNSFFREGAQIFNINATNGFYEGLSAVTEIMFDNCEFRGMTGVYFNLPSVVSSIVKNVSIKNSVVREGLVNSGNNVQCFILNGKNISVQGNTIAGNWTNAGSPIILAQDGCTNVQLSNNIFDVARTDRIVVGNSAVNVVETNNI